MSRWLDRCARVGMVAGTPLTALHLPSTVMLKSTFPQ